jgi:hypothetical protein
MGHPRPPASRSRQSFGLAALPQRIHRDYLQRSRLHRYREFLIRALELGYRTMTLSAFARHVADESAGTGERILILRHDIDSDVSRAHRMWMIERELGAVGTYFFRLATWDLGLMREQAESGWEVGYHYEELATLVKRRGARTADEARALIVPARARLQAHLAELRAESGLALDVAASHGDFANRAVGVSNVELLADTEFRARAGVRLEAYDLDGHVDARTSDEARPGYWFPLDPLQAVERGERAVLVLLHPRAWGAAPIVNAVEDTRRAAAGTAFWVRRQARRSR